MSSINLLGEELQLLPEKGLYWEKYNLLILADTHFGKVSHFRKAGIAIPSSAAYQNLDRFRNLIRSSGAKEIMILGDLFHSELNLEWMVFKEVLAEFIDCSFHLVLGNHDILHPWSYDKTSLVLHNETRIIPPFLFSHEAFENEDYYNIYGHIHPGVKLSGPARQNYRLPCFYFGEKQAILPAFGEFTGLSIIQPKKEDRIFVISGEEVIEMF